VPIVAVQKTTGYAKAKAPNLFPPPWRLTIWRCFVGSRRNFRGKEQRPISSTTVSSRLQEVVKSLIDESKLLLDDEQSRNNITVFLYQSRSSEIIADLMQEMQMQASVQNKELFMSTVSKQYDNCVATHQA
jgi:hypothetical protein